MPCSDPLGLVVTQKYRHYHRKEFRSIQGWFLTQGLILLGDRFVGSIERPGQDGDVGLTLAVTHKHSVLNSNQ
jgi:hypothetical protein